MVTLAIKSALIFSGYLQLYLQSLNMLLAQSLNEYFWNYDSYLLGIVQLKIKADLNTSITPFQGLELNVFRVHQFYHFLCHYVSDITETRVTEKPQIKQNFLQYLNLRPRYNFYQGKLTAYPFVLQTEENE